MLNDLRRLFPVLGLSLLLLACGGGGGSPVTGNDDGGDDDGGGTPNPSPTNSACSGTGEVSVSGVAEYEFVPAVPTTGGGARLDYAASEFRAVRQATVVAASPDDAEYARTVTGEDGSYCLGVPENVNVQISVHAAMQLPAWNVRVVDNTRDQGLWAAEGEVFNSGTDDLEVNLRMDSGWNGASYSGSRSAAPFAILDSVHTAMQKVVSVDADAQFPALTLNWSPDNRNCGENGDSEFPFADGCIGSSFFANYGGTAGRNIFILGDANSDTDEYDNHVIIHEWGHYYENAFSRSDSIGGRHRGGDALDPRVAFGEGFGNAFSGIATDDPLYIDTSGAGQANGFVIDIENEIEGQPGWWNEVTIQEIIYDLYDAAPLDADNDGVALGFAPIHTVLTLQQRNTEAVTSIFSFIHYLKTTGAGAAVSSDIEALVRAQDIATITDVWGSGRSGGGILPGEPDDDGSEFGHPENVSPVHTPLGTVNPGSSTNICTSNQVDPASADEYNRLGARRFLRFNVADGGTWRIQLSGLNDGLGVNGDPDFYVYLRGAEVTRSNSQDPSQSGASNSPANEDLAGEGVEAATVTLAANTRYVIEVLDWLNVNDDASDGGDDVCLDLTFEKLIL